MCIDEKQINIGYKQHALLYCVTQSQARHIYGMRLIRVRGSVISQYLKSEDDVVSCVLPTPGLVSSGGPAATLGTDVSRLPKAVEQPSSWS